MFIYVDKGAILEVSKLMEDVDAEILILQCAPTRYEIEIPDDIGEVVNEVLNDMGLSLTNVN